VLLPFVTTHVLAQTPQKMSYQAVVRDNNNELLQNQPVGMRFSILKGSTEGAVVYTETQTPATNINGLITIEIGGQPGFSEIDWGSDSYFAKIEIDPVGETNYTIASTSQLLSVPYALYAQKAGNTTQLQVRMDALAVESGARVKDIDGNFYKVVTIGSQVWMAENLRVTRFNNGAPITLVISDATWSNTTLPAYCWYNNDSTTYAGIYGALYNFHVNVTSTFRHNVCPAGWHIPSQEEYNTMLYYLYSTGFSYDDDTQFILGTKIKVAKSLASTGNWKASTIEGTPGNTDFPYKQNVTGFALQPAGYRLNGFHESGQGAYLWTSSSVGLSSHPNAFNGSISYNSPNADIYNSNKRAGFSIRCVRD
jgi:uncharacterized protein (TIGR02145 family)